MIVRVFSLMGFMGGFLLISPKLRDTGVQFCLYVAENVAAYSPYSYVGLGLASLIALAFLLNSDPKTR